MFRFNGQRRAFYLSFSIVICFIKGAECTIEITEDNTTEDLKVFSRGSFIIFMNYAFNVNYFKRQITDFTLKLFETDKNYHLVKILVSWDIFVLLLL